jgi:hypothetical protein
VKQHSLIEHLYRGISTFLKPNRGVGRFGCTATASDPRRRP